MVYVLRDTSTLLTAGTAGRFLAHLCYGSVLFDGIKVSLRVCDVFLVCLSFCLIFGEFAEREEAGSMLLILSRGCWAWAIRDQVRACFPQILRLPLLYRV